MFTTVAHSTGTSATVFVDGTVQPATRYAYRVKAINDAGLSRQSRYVNVTTLAVPPPTVPAKPTGLTTSAVASDSVVLEWDDPGDDTVTGYRILRRDIANQPAGTFTVLAEDTGSAATSYADATVEPDTRYAYRIVALNAAGASRKSMYVNVTTPAVPEPAPEQPAATPAPDAFVPTFEIEEVVYVPPPDIEPALIAMYQMTETRVTAYTATMTAGGASRPVDETTYSYTGFATGTPATFGSMSSTTMTVTSSIFYGCPSEGCNNSTVTELYYVSDDSDNKTHLVFRPGRKIPDGFTLTIGDNSYDLADSGYFVTADATYMDFPVGPDMHFWYDVGRPSSIAGGVTVTLDRPVYQAPTYDDVLNDVDWNADMRVGERREKFHHYEPYSVLNDEGESVVRYRPRYLGMVIRGYERSTRKGSLRIGGVNADTISANSKQYRILGFNITYTPGGSLLVFRVEGGRLGDDATVHIGGRSYPVTDARWSPVHGSHYWSGLPYHLDRQLSGNTLHVSISSD